jgi:hypothetical protein
LVGLKVHIEGGVTFPKVGMDWQKRKKVSLHQKVPSHLREMYFEM